MVSSMCTDLYITSTQVEASSSNDSEAPSVYEQWSDDEFEEEDDDRFNPPMYTRNPDGGTMV